MGTQRLEKERFIGLEWLRFLLGCYVMIYHTSHVYPQLKKVWGLSEITSMGFFATSTFFILSGFLLTHVYVRGSELKEKASGFWKKRLFNLYPIHIMALLASFLVIMFMNWVAIPPEGTTASMRFVIYDTHEVLGQTHPELFRHYMDNGQLAFNLLLQFFMLQAWNPYFLTFNAPLWSLSTLCFFYFLFPWIAPKLANVRRPHIWLIVIGVIYLIPPLLIVITHQYGMPYTGLLQRGPIFRLPEFLAGIVGYALFRQIRLNEKTFTPTNMRLIGLGIIGAFFIATLLFTHGEDYWYFMLHNGLLLPAQIALIYLCAQLKAPSSEWIRHWLPRLGGASLPIFAFHVPLFSLWRTIEQFLRGAPLACLNDQPYCIAKAAQISLSLPGYGLYLLSTIFFALIFQEHFVVPVRTYLQRRFIRS
ncbi:acyltransferase family protein [Celerinatantimonas sp. YJH-8]|uniref:acyltransferase family protein n=1 Tax=Celerinatantimonas sp. YJH-8 TaxID=3228714 RepID=UPI0038C1A672